MLVNVTPVLVGLVLIDITCPDKLSMGVLSSAVFASFTVMMILYPLLFTCGGLFPEFVPDPDLGPGKRLVCPAMQPAGNPAVHLVVVSARHSRGWRPIAR